jgi:hypothetical protein
MCDHPVYDECTLFLIEDNGLAVIQQRFDEASKTTKWGSIDPWLTDMLYLHPKFKEFFDNRSGECTDGLYPTVTIRQIMWALKLKPIRKERWETCFDRKNISYAIHTFPIMKRKERMEMDELKLKLSTKIMKGIIAKLISKFISKKLGCKINIQINELELVTIGDKVELHACVDAEANKDEFMAAIKNIDLD